MASRAVRAVAEVAANCASSAREITYWFTGSDAGALAHALKPIARAVARTILRMRSIVCADGG
jgi:hypothetical protein